MAKQYGFLFNADRCVMCRACEVACKMTHDPGAWVSWRKVIDIWQGEFPDVTRTFVSLSCLHCARPSCREACPTGAISKRAEDGIVAVDKDKCTGCRECYAACPYGVPQFGADGLMQKCDLCLGRGSGPACTEPCPADALVFGTMEELAKVAREKDGRLLPGPQAPSLFILSSRGLEIDSGSLAIPRNPKD